MSKALGADAQGELQGTLTSVSALAMILSPMVMTGTFAAFTAPGTPMYQPGAPFLLSAALVAIALFVFVRRTARTSFSS